MTKKLCCWKILRQNKFRENEKKDKRCLFTGGHKPQMKREGLKDRFVRYNLQNKNKAGRPKKEMKL